MITENQKIRRKNYIGSSDAAAIAGIDKWKSAFDVYASKVYEICEEEKVNDAIEVGNACEDAILKWFANESGMKLTKNQFRVHHNGFMAANLDAIAKDDCGNKYIVEAKTAGVTSPLDREAWGEIGTGEIPEKYILQCQHQLAVCGDEFNAVYVPVLLGGVGFRLYKINRDNELISYLLKIEEKFWFENVKKNIPPEQTSDNYFNLDIAKKIKRVPNKIVNIDEKIIEEWLDAKRNYNNAAKIKDAKEALLLSLLGDAEASKCSIGMLTYYEQSRLGYSVAPKTFRALKFLKEVK